MADQTTFVDVVVPLAIPNLLTYRVPREIENEVLVGQRIVVQLGKSKLYTALIRKIHNQAPAKYQAKYVESLLDERPVVHESQFRLWEWMAGYYMCTLGEVMNAALPSSLKLASETKVMIDDDWDGIVDDLSDKAYIIVEALQVQETLTLKDISDILGQKTVQPIVNQLVAAGVVITEEDMKRKYRPKIVEYVKLSPTAKEEENLSGILDDLDKRAPKQMELLMSYLKMSKHFEGDPQPVKKLDLQKSVDGNASLVNALVKKDVFQIEGVQVGRIDDGAENVQASFGLSDDQQGALEEIEKHFEDKDVTLFHGVTSSGKTEVYVKLIEEHLKKGEQVLFLLPEIALTTQLINRLRRFFGTRIGVYHSRFNQNERVEVWNDVLKSGNGKYDIVIGPRSALFLPFKKLGLVIVDEEHESSYKQFDPAPRYNARDMAIVLAKIHKAKVLLGSATPSIESFWNAEHERYGLVKLTKRFGGIQMPEIHCADIRMEMKSKTMKSIFTSYLLREMEEVLKENGQIILFQNRRGYAPLWQCNICGWVPNCTRCDVSLTYHKYSHSLKCHYCGYSTNPPTTCDACGSSDLKMLGFGTEKIEEELSTFLPKAKIARMDLDTTRSKNAYQNLIFDFEEGKIDILVGTQMVTKGLDFDNVRLVGILNADQMLNFPDFRSFERSYQLMAQVAGRAGRKGDRGKVIIQTYTPDHWIIQQVMHNQYEEMYRQEIFERKSYYYPPFYRLIYLTLKHRDKQLIERAANYMADDLRKLFGNRVLGPEMPYVSRIYNKYLFEIKLKLERDASPAKFKEMLNEKIIAFKAQPDFKQVQVVIDVDPM
ncbi:replication restart helicase PriA [Halocola ammonii]